MVPSGFRRATLFCVPPWTWLKSPASTGDTLILEIRNAPTAPVPGRLAYREPVPDPLPKKISFFCRGAEISALTRIEQVY